MKIIAFDLDRTLLRTDETLSPYTIQTMEACANAGYKLVVATARSLYSTQLVCQHLSPHAIIHTGGAFAVAQDQVLYEALLSPQDTLRGVEICMASPHVHHIRISGQAHEVTTNPAIPLWELEFGHYRRIPVELLPEYANQAATKITVCTDNPDAVAQLFQHTSPLSFTPSNNTGSFGHKISHQDATKEAALARVADYFGATLQDVLAFGDDMADVGMLSVCGDSVAVDNAIPQVKGVAKHICPDNDHDGVARYLQKLL